MHRSLVANKLDLKNTTTQRINDRNQTVAVDLVGGVQNAPRMGAIYLGEPTPSKCGGGEGVVSG